MKSNNSKEIIKVLHVDDEEDFIELSRIFLEKYSDKKIIVEGTTSTERVFDLLAKGNYDVLVSDYQMPNLSGLQLLEKLRKEKNDIPFIIFTGRGREEVAIEALNLGADYYIKKGLDPKNLYKELALIVTRIAQRWKLRKELDKTKAYADSIIKTVRNQLVILNQELRIISSNNQFNKSLNIKNEEAENELIYEVGNKVWNIPELKELLEEILPKNTSFDNFEVSIEYPEIGKRSMLVNARRLYGETGKTQMILLSIEDMTELKKNQERTENLNKILHALRNINQLITKENDRDSLLQGCCETFTQIRGFYNAWIVLLDSKGNFITSAESGIGGDFSEIQSCLEKGKLLDGCLETWEDKDVNVISDFREKCKKCPLAPHYKGRAGMVAKLKYEDNIYGLLTISLAPELIDDPEEIELFKEIAEDIGFALYKIEMQKWREQAQEELKNREIMLTEKTQELGERVKELKGLYEIAKITLESDSIEEAVKEILLIIPPAMQYPEITSSRISINENVYFPPNFKETEWKISSHIMREHQIVGKIEIFYIEEKPEEDIGPFLKEEVNLIDGMSALISQFVTRILEISKLTEQEELFRILADNMDGGFGVKDENMMFLYVNDRFCEIIGHAREAILGNRMDKFLEDTSLPVYEEQMKKIRIGEIEIFDLNWKKQDGNISYTNILYHPILGQDGKLEGIYTLITDVSDRLMYLREKAKQMEEKSLLLDILTHDLKNYQQTAIGFLENYLDSSDSIENSELVLLEKVKSAIIRTNSLINNISIMMKENVEETYTLVPVNLYELVEDNVIILKEIYPKKELIINFESISKDIQIKADNLASQMLLNILTNAVKYNKNDTKIIDFKFTKEDENIILSISDNGIGISPENRKEVFTRFSTISKESRGTGLGLYIVKTLCERYNGMIWIENKVKEDYTKGTVFNIQFKIA